MAREAIDLPRLKKYTISMVCPQCHTTAVQVSTVANSLVWYCASCDVYHQTTTRGVPLRSYKKEAENIINIPLPEEV